METATYIRPDQAWRRVRHHDLAGRRFGKLAVIGPGVCESGHAGWSCQCDCGVVKVVRTNGLTSGKNTSCGCSRPRAQIGSAIHTTHGRCRTAEYRSYWSMLARCLNSKDKNYADYGGRGISICQRWRESFENFFADMGQRPAGTTLGRIKNDGNYEPGNCRWETGSQQARNKRNSRLLTAFGETKGMPFWLEDPRCKVGHKVLDARLRAGWKTEAAISTPKLNVRRFSWERIESQS